MLYVVFRSSDWTFLLFYTSGIQLNFFINLFMTAIQKANYFCGQLIMIEFF